MDKFRLIRFVAIVAIFMAYQSSKPKNQAVDPPHKFKVMPYFLSNSQHKKLMSLFENEEKFPGAKDDWTSSRYTSVGEESFVESPTEDAQCNTRYTMYNRELQQCQFPNRMDIGRHFIVTGGYNGHKESYDTLASRIQPFINYQLDDTQIEQKAEFKELFEADEFREAVEDICGTQHPFFRPFQLSLILNLPGQSVPMHLDIPYFFGATRYEYPQWLLLVMQDSGLFQERRLPQVQALVYIHDWETPPFGTDEEGEKAFYEQKGGEFVVYPKGPDYKPVVIPAKPQTAVFCDGAEMVHGTSTFTPTFATERKMPQPIPLDKDLDNFMKFSFIFVCVYICTHF